MSADFTFPSYVPKSIDQGEAHAFLHELMGVGFVVTRKPIDSGAEIFYIEIDEDYSIRVSLNDGKSQIQLRYRGNMTNFRNVDSITDFQAQINDYIKDVTGSNIANWSPQSIRTSKDLPASNLAQLSKLIGGATVVAYFDPYLDNLALQRLSDIITLGKGKLSANLRLISSSKTLKNKRQDLSKSFTDIWFKEHSLNGGELRLEQTEKEHRRFLLLDNDKVVIIPFSLNQVDKNETAHVEENLGDVEFFEEQWIEAKPI